MAEPALVKEATTPQKKHVRPAVRGRAKEAVIVKKEPSSAQTSEKNRASLETQQLIETWAGSDKQKSAFKPKKGILKQPKYTGKSIDDTEGRIQPEEASEKPERAVQPLVRERPRQRRTAPPPRSSQPSAVEGYTPKTANNNTKDDSDDELLVFSSLADLMQLAGTLPKPSNDITNGPPAVVEADLEFTCMDPAEYEQQKENNDVDIQRDVEERERMSDDEDDDEGSWDGFWAADDNEEEEEEAEPRPEGAFLKLWNVLSQWVTPQAVQYVRHLQQLSCNDDDSTWDGTVAASVNRSDVEASRCAGLMALLQMHIAKSLVEIGQPVETQRLAEQRLLELLRCGDYRRPVRLDTSLARAFTCVLLETVLPSSRSNGDDAALPRVPPSCQAIDMKPEEYRYLTQSAIVSFGTPEDE